MKEVKLKLFELVIGRKDSAITAISIVNEGAIEVDFVKLNKDKHIIKLSTDEDQMIVTGPALIPNKKIYRNEDFYLGECEIMFSAETIKDIAKLFLSGENVHNSTLEHLIPTDKVEIVESWLVLDKDSDKSTALGFDVPNGTWMVSYYVEDIKLWNVIKNGDFNAFSIEGNFTGIEVKASKEDKKVLLSNDEFNSLSDYILSKLKKLNK